MSVNFNSVSLTYKGHSINITNNIDENRPDFRRVTIFLDDGDYEEVQHVDEFDMNIDSLIETLNKAKELIDWYINANEMLHIKKG